MILGFPLFPIAASTISGQVDSITIVLLLLSGGILVLVSGLILTFGILYCKGTSRSREIHTQDQRTLEWGWTLAPLLIFLSLFGWGTVVYFRMHSPPSGSSEIMVVGKQWMWKFQHPNGKRELNELHVPVGVPILLTMTSEDVIHSFFVPDFRVKQDVLPGRYSRLWFEANRLGEHHLFCTQYCGTQHSKMRGRVIVLSQSDYQQWLQSGTPTEIQGETSSRVTGRISGTSATLTMASRGGRLFTRLGCISCHGVNPGVRAPSLYGIFGKPVGLSNGTTVIADEDYIRESILNPNAKLVQGYEPIMPSFSGLIGEEDVLDLIAYIKSLQGTSQSASPEGPQATSALPSPPPLTSPSNFFGRKP